MNRIRRTAYPEQDGTTDVTTAVTGERRMKRIGAAVVLVAGALALAGCAHRQPLIAHAHIGHCVTTWHDTPDNRGLLEVAEQELQTALREANAALAPDIGPSQKSRHMRNVLHALNPDAQPSGPGLSYGAIRALEGAVEHLEYAATSQDASLNIASSVAGISELGFSVLQRMRHAAVKAASAPRDAAALDRTAADLYATLRIASTGYDVNGNGRVDVSGTEAGIMQMHAELDAMLARESDPAYQPLPHQYLLGVVRMPNGKWAYSSVRRALSRVTQRY
jgi:hypothetical protein